MIDIQSYEESTVVCQLSGHLDVTTSIHLRHLLSEILEPGIHLVIDLGQVSSITAVGVSALVGIVRRVISLGGTTRLCNATPRVRWYLSLVGADRVLGQSCVPVRPDAA
jgi:anti-sigma B factor antagonist